TYSIPNAEDIKKFWEEFSCEIKEKNRFFTQTNLYKDLFNNQVNNKTNIFNLLIESLTNEYSNGRKFYRARVHENKLSIDEMGAPPANTATAGRANPIGIPYLYLADNKDTAIAEVRPSNACLVSVGTFQLISNLKILNLTNPRKDASFLIHESDNLEECLKYIDLLEIFSSELSKPVLPNKSYLDYIPTQFLCEYFKTVCGFDGLVFKSSFEEGNNLVLFEKSFSKGIDMAYFTVKIKHQSSVISTRN
ncbi:RES family NAD+ phosphorylase, partial [Acinetobacter sp. YK3]|uniref:RES family NAD+ phosphorylase n=1 Tax=Acinetobacter sp. YK3 TaxID=1860097 RepID=UPI001112F8A4